MSTPSYDFAGMIELIARLQQPPPDGSTAPDGGAFTGTRQERLNDVLNAACRRGGFRTLALCDAAGLPLAMVDSPIDEAHLAGLTAVLGEALERVSRLWEGPQPETLSMDIDYSDKLVFRSFIVDRRGYSMMGVCPQDLDERGEIELAVSSVSGLIRRGITGGDL